MAGNGIHSMTIAETPICVIDFETTGLRPGTDRVVEASVVRLDPDQPPRLVFDSLINPRRKMAATEIHGITDAEVADAPTFQQIVGDMLEAMSGCVIAAYNVYFDVPFLEYELRHAGQRISGIPHFCVMYLRPMLGLGGRCCLEEACRAHGHRYEASHRSSSDALAASALLQSCMVVMRNKGLRTFGELTALAEYKFLQSFSRFPFAGNAIGALTCGARTKSRAKSTATTPQPRRPIAVYWDALIACLADLTIDPAEVTKLQALKQELDLPFEQIAMLHARAFGAAIDQFIEDKVVTVSECEKLQRLHECLRMLGWAPGDTT